MPTDRVGSSQYVRNRRGIDASRLSEIALAARARDWLNFADNSTRDFEGAAVIFDRFGARFGLLRPRLFPAVAIKAQPLDHVISTRLKVIAGMRISNEKRTAQSPTASKPGSGPASHG